MARKCDTAKYRRQRARELKNRKERVTRQQAFDHQFRKAQAEWRERRQWEWDHDERRLLMLRLIKILKRRLGQSPEYRLTQLASLWRGLARY